MTKKETQRYAAGLIVAAACNVLDSTRVMVSSDVLRTFSDELSDKEKRYLDQRGQTIRHMVDDLRRLSFKLRGQDPVNWSKDSTLFKRHASK